MSLGIGASCKKETETQDEITYSYAILDLNRPEFSPCLDVYDGIITVNKSSLLSPIIYEKQKKFCKGKTKSITKTIKVAVPLDEFLKNGMAKIENSKHSDKIDSDGYDFFAKKLCVNIYDYYQLNTALPEKSFFQM